MDLLSTSASEWQEHLQNAKLTSLNLVDLCLDQIERHNRRGQCLNALINVASRETLHKRAKMLDEERAAGKLRSPMHGIPIVVKDIFPIDISLGMPTTCGAYAFRAAYGKKNCPLIERLLDAGMIIIGKSNLNEYCRVRDVKSGWSALGGQSQSPYVEGGLIPNEAPVGNSTISGSSSGSAASVAAGFAPVAIGSETTGSVVVPANRCGLYSLKVTNNRAPKQQALLLSREHDSIGPMTKSAVDLRSMVDIVLGKTSIPGHDDIEVPQVSKDQLRVGFVDPRKWRFSDEICPQSGETRELLNVKLEKTIETLRSSGIQVLSDVSLSDEDIEYEGENVIGLVVDAQFRDNFAEYVAGLTGTEIKSLTDLIAYNEKHADAALPHPFEDQKHLKRTNEIRTPEKRVQDAIEHGRRMAGSERLDRVMDAGKLDLLIGPGDSNLFAFASRAGYPIGSMPWCSVEYDDRKCRPEGLLVIGRADAEDIILDFMLKYEELFPGRPLPAPLLKST